MIKEPALEPMRFAFRHGLADLVIEITLLFFNSIPSVPKETEVLPTSKLPELSSLKPSLELAINLM